MTVDPSIRALVAPFEVETLEADPSTIYALGPDLRIAYFNPAWVEFARANGAPWDDSTCWIGRSVLDPVPAVLRPFYQGVFERAQRTRAPVEHSYECSSPQALRLYHMRVFPCGAGALLVVHSLAYEGAHPSIPHTPIESIYRHPNGLITQCSHCRRVRRVGSRPHQWDWVAEYVERIPPMTSHGLCLLCCEYYYPSRLEARA